MNQQKTGQFLKELRNEKAITQEQFAQILGVSNRSVSRWENGVTMPDFDLLIQIAEYFEVEIGEILDGERKVESMEKETEEVMLKVADYNNAEKMVFSKRFCRLSIAGVAAFVAYMAMDILELTGTAVYDAIADFLLGLVFGDLLVGVLYSSRYISKIQAFKMRLLRRNQ